MKKKVDWFHDQIDDSGKTRLCIQGDQVCDLSIAKVDYAKEYVIWSLETLLMLLETDKLTVSEFHGYIKQLCDTLKEYD